MKKVTNKEIKRIKERLKLNDENIMLEYAIALLSLVSEIRDISKDKKICSCSNLKKDPLKYKKNDILTGDE